MPLQTALIIDDDTEARETLKELLGPNYRVLQASDGESALKIADGIKPDLILLDMEMPGIDGIQVCTQLRSRAIFDSTPSTHLMRQRNRGNAHGRGHPRFQPR